MRQVDLDSLIGQPLGAFTGNGTTGLAIALRALDVNGGRVGIPSSVCLAVPLAVIASGNIPEFIDVDDRNLGINLSGLASRIEELDAVIAVHNYGYPSEMQEVAQLCQLHSVPLVEDACLLYGCEINGLPVGSFGQISVISFGTGKILDVGGGGAVFAGDSHLRALLRQAAGQFPISNSALLGSIQLMSSSHTQVYNEFFLQTFNPTRLRAFGAWMAAVSSQLLLSADKDLEPKLRKAVRDLDSRIEVRRERYALLEDLLLDRLSPSTGFLHNPPVDSVPWRLNSRAVQQAILFRRLKVAGVPASTWHPPAQVFFSDRKIMAPIAETWGRTVVNLPLGGDSESFGRMVQTIDRELS